MASFGIGDEIKFTANQQVPSVFYVEELCEECGYECERQWASKMLAKGCAVPKRWRVVKRLGSWKHVACPTNMTTLCMCPE
jgi:hypothetical protein